MGQLKAIGETFYKIKLDISVLDQEVKFDTIHVSFKLAFENKSTLKVNSAMLREEARLPAVSSSILFEIFPFIIVFGEDMVIQTIGRSLNQVCISLGMNSSMFANCLVFCDVRHVRSSVLGQNVMF